MANSYITLANSTGTLSKRFNVILGGYKVTYHKTGSERETIDGSLDVCQGGVRRDIQYVLRVSEAVADSNYGTLANLQTLFNLNNPQATPTNKITLTDHYGNTIYCYLTRNLELTPQTTILTGNTSLFLIPVTLREAGAAT